MSRKLDLTRGQMLSLLKKCYWVKTEVAKALRVSESCIRRECLRLDIDVEEEKIKGIEDFEIKKVKAVKSKNKKGFIKGRFVILPDIHDKNVDWDVLDAVCEFIKDYRPEYVVQLGDLLDYECLMEKRNQKYPSFDGRDLEGLKEGYYYSSIILNKINEVCPQGCKKVFLEGNHEYRATVVIAKSEFLRDILCYERNVDFSGWEIHRYLEPYKLGKLYIIHGEFFGANHVQKHLRHYQKNVAYGHTHDIQTGSMASPLREIPIFGWSLGCLCNLSPGYQNKKSSSWSHGFGYGMYDEKSGDFDLTAKRIIHKKFWAEGKRYGVVSGK